LIEVTFPIQLARFFPKTVYLFCNTNSYDKKRIDTLNVLNAEKMTAFENLKI